MCSWKQFSRGIDYLHKLYLYLNTQVTSFQMSFSIEKGLLQNL